MKRIYFAIASISLLTALCCYLFHIDNYDFFTQLKKIASIEFPNPLEEINNLIDSVNRISPLMGGATEDRFTHFEWFDYLKEFIGWLGLLLTIPLIIIKDFVLNLAYGLMAVTYLLGF